MKRFDRATSRDARIGAPGRVRRTSAVVRAAALALGLALALAACSKRHGDLPTPLGVTPPPTVTNFVVTQPDTTNPLDYDLAWSIADPSVVDHYRIYLVVSDIRGTTAEQVATTTTTTFLATLALPVPDVQFGVTVVTTEHVEGAMVVARPQ